MHNGVNLYNIRRFMYVQLQRG